MNYFTYPVWVICVSVTVMVTYLSRGEHLIAPSATTSNAVTCIRMRCFQGLIVSTVFTRLLLRQSCFDENSNVRAEDLSLTSGKSLPQELWPLSMINKIGDDIVTRSIFFPRAQRLRDLKQASNARSL